MRIVELKDIPEVRVLGEEALNSENGPETLFHVKSVPFRVMLFR